MAARKAVADGLYPCLKVSENLDTVLRDVPATVRRPDVVLYECLEPGQRLLTADKVLLVVEIVFGDLEF